MDLLENVAFLLGASRDVKDLKKQRELLRGIYNELQNKIRTLDANKVSETEA